ncbi:pentapeptide repeat-containing protein [Amycolatopsis sp. NPDC058278]|uniref:pentapeptide repeat-containing protein n=1 Tax=Amycolatopsis sp. NPDC058278 TaxID=3346417 RepID=UPI0036D7C3F9
MAWGAISWLLGEADRASTADAKAAAKVDAVKTGLGIGTGTTGIFALLLAVRRQTHQERTAADTIHDATERRVTELYTKAADQLGSPKAAVRLAGLYALERLGVDHVSQRATIIDLLCAYLRMRYSEPAEPDGGSSPEQFDRYEDRLQEAQVRTAAQRILCRHSTDSIDLHWAQAARMILDLRGACLIDAKFELADLTGAMLDGADLSGADFSHAMLAGASLVCTNLTGAKLYGVELGHIAMPLNLVDALPVELQLSRL